MRPARVAAVLDICCVLIFVVIGRASHAKGESLAGIASTCWPFLCGLAAGWLAARAWRRPLAIRPAGITVWLMVEFEADDALASAAAAAAADPRVERVIICTPDKDLAQCVRGTRVVQLNRRTRTVYDEAGVVAKFGVPPGSIPDYLALVGDAADGFPGLQGWGAKSAAAVLARFGHLEAIPADARNWNVNVASPAKLANTLQRDRALALLFRNLATLRTHIPLFDDVETLRWNGQNLLVAAGFTPDDSTLRRAEGGEVTPR